MKRTSWLISAALLLVLSLIAAIWGLGSGYSNVITPRSQNGELVKIKGDAWAESGAQILLRDLAPRGNRAEIELGAWRPAGAGPAELQFSVCGIPAHEQVLDKDSTVAVYLTGDCEPRAITITAKNPFIGSASDSRRLATQVKAVRVTSRLGVPLLEFELIAQVALAIFALSLLVWAFAQQWKIGIAAALVPLCASLILVRVDRLDLANPTALWMFWSCFFLGALLCHWATHQGDDRKGFPDRFPFWIVLLVVAIGAGLRFYGIDFGLPANFHPDEVPKVNAIMRMREFGDLNPRYFLHPSLLLYCSYFLNFVLQACGIGGEFRDSAFLAGRLVSASAGTLSILFTYLIGRRLYGARAGVLSAALLAVFPLHVTCSRYMKEDALLLFWILVCLYLVIRAAQDDQKRLLLFAGLVAGLSASTKYSGLLTGGILFAAPWLRTKKWTPDWEYVKWACFGLLLMPVGFVIATPYSILDSGKFYQDFSSERRHMERGHTTAVDSWSQLWMYHFGRSIIGGLTLPTALLSVIGMGFLVRRMRREDLLLVGLILLYYLPAEFVKAKPAPQPERYILPCLPFLAIACSQFISALIRSRFTILAALGLIVAIAFPAVRTIELASEIRSDTRLQMAQWMRENLPPGSKVAFDWKPYGPRFFHNEFNVTYLLRSEIVDSLNIKALENSGQDYLVLSGLFYDRYFIEPNSPAGIRQRFRELFDRVPIIKEFRPKFGTYGFHNPTVTLFSLKPDDIAKLNAELEARDAGQLEQTTNQARAQFRWSLRK